MKAFGESMLQNNLVKSGEEIPKQLELVSSVCRINRCELQADGGFEANLSDPNSECLLKKKKCFIKKKKDICLKLK